MAKALAFRIVYRLLTGNVDAREAKSKAYESLNSGAKRLMLFRYASRQCCDGASALDDFGLSAGDSPGTSRVTVTIGSTRLAGW
jgi:hypothetical protein